MKLANVFTAQGSMARLAGLKMAPKIAYQVLKFSRKFEAECAIIENQRVALIKDLSGAKEGENVSIKPKTPEYIEFVMRFNEVLSVDSELALCPVEIGALLDSIDESGGNTLSVQDIALLELFFESDNKKEKT